MMSCRSSSQTQRQLQTERVVDTLVVKEYVIVHDTTTNTVHDTVRETTTVYLDANGDTTRKDTNRERVTDRTIQQKNESVREATRQESHEKEAARDEKKTVIEQPKSTPIKPFLWGTLTGIVLTISAVIFVKLRKR